MLSCKFGRNLVWYFTYRIVENLRRLKQIWNIIINEKVYPVHIFYPQENIKERSNFTVCCFKIYWKQFHTNMGQTV
jgi:hypothetical protein